MRALRKGLILALATPAPALAEVCDILRPSWDGQPVSAVAEALQLAATVPVVVLLIATALVVRFRSQWGGLVVAVLWTVVATIHAMVDPSGLQTIARAEGCVGSPALFIAVVAAICVAMILYTAPAKKRPD